MIGKISTPRGEHVQPLLYYLFGPGRQEEHTGPHIIAGWRHPADLEPPLRPDGTRDFIKLAGLLLQPQAALGKRAYARPVWHCSMRTAPEDRMLSDDEWAAIAHDVLDRTGLAPYGQEDEAVRWVAVRHGDDHIHLVAMLARQDGGKPGLSWERVKVRAACLAAEQQYGLRSTAPADRTAARRPTRAENEKAARRGLDEAPRVTLRRQVTTAAASANSELEFFARLGQAGVLVRKRVQHQEPGSGHRVLGRAAWRHRQDRRPGLVRGRETRSRPDLAQTPAAVDTRPGHTRPPAPGPDCRGTQRDLGARHQDRSRRRRADPHPGRDEPGRRRRRRVGHLRYFARGGRHARQPHPAPGSRRLRPRRAFTLRSYPAAVPGREPAPAGRPADIRVRLPHPGPVDGPDPAHHQAGCARRSRRRTPPIPAARRPGRRRTTRRRTFARRRLPGTATPPSATRQHRRPARRAVLPRTSPACRTTTRTRTARP